MQLYQVVSNRLYNSAMFCSWNSGIRARYQCVRLQKNKFKVEKGVTLPVNPENRQPLILVPKRWLRFAPWISFDDYFKDHCPQDDIAHAGEVLKRVDVLNFNRSNFDLVEAYIREKGANL